MSAESAPLRLVTPSDGAVRSLCSNWMHLPRQHAPEPRWRLLRCSFFSPRCAIESASEEIQNRLGNLLLMRFQGEVAGVVKMHFGIRDVALEGIGAGGQKERIVLAPHRQQRWRVLAEIFLELGIECHIAGIV